MIRSRLSLKFIWLLAAAPVLLVSPRALGDSTPGRTWHVAQAELPGVPSDVQVRTIGEAAARVQPGDTVVIHGDTYRERVLVETSGTAEKPITFVAAPGEHVVVTGADRITEWEQADPTNPIYRTPWPYWFIPWSETGTHPDDERHLVIGRAEQVIINDYLLHQTGSPTPLAPGEPPVGSRSPARPAASSNGT